MRRLLGILFLAVVSVGLVLALMSAGCVDRPFGNGINQTPPAGQPHGDPDQPHDN